MSASRPWLSAVAVAGVAAAAAMAALGNGFAYDDVPGILENAQVQSWHGLRDVVTRPFWAIGEHGVMWRPVVSALHTVQWMLGQGSPRVFHGVNLFLTVATALAALAVFRRLLDPARATAAALLFAALPVHVEVTANITGQSELLCTVFALLAARTWLDGPATTGARLRLGLWCLLAAASKEQGLLVPLLLLALDGARSTARPARSTQRPAALAAFGGMAAAAAVRTLVLGGFGQGDPIPALAGLGIVERLCVMTAIVPTVLRVLILPDRLLADYNPVDVPLAVRPDADVAVGALLLAAVLAVCLSGPERRRTGALLLCAALAFAPAANILVPTGVLFAERHLFLPTVPLAALAVLRWPSERPLARSLGAMLLGAAVLLGTWRSVRRAPDWKDNTTLFAALTRDAPRNYRGLRLAATEAARSGHPDSAEALLRRALVLYDGDAAVHEELGQLIRRREGCKAALALFQRAAQLQASRITAQVRADECARQVARLPTSVQTDPAVPPPTPRPAPPAVSVPDSVPAAPPP